MRSLPLLALLAAAVSAPALSAPARPEPTKEKPATVTVLMSGRAFVPQVIRLDSHRPVRLRIVNRDTTTHDFTAPAFFYAARLNADDSSSLRGDRIVVPPGGMRTITLIPAVGHYDLKSSRALDVVSNMQGQILVY